MINLQFRHTFRQRRLYATKERIVAIPIKTKLRRGGKGGPDKSTIVDKNTEDNFRSTHFIPYAWFSTYENEVADKLLRYCTNLTKLPKNCRPVDVQAAFMKDYYLSDFRIFGNELTTSIDGEEFKLMVGNLEIDYTFKDIFLTKLMELYEFGYLTKRRLNDYVSTFSVAQT